MLIKGVGLRLLGCSHETRRIVSFAITKALLGYGRYLR